MNRINNVEGFLNEVKVAFPGYQILVNIKTLMELANKEIVVNDENNRRPDESKWNKENFKNFSQRIKDTSENFKEYGHRDGFVGLMANSSITMHINEDSITLDDGGHRFDFFKVLNEFGFGSKFLKDLTNEHFFKKIVECCINKKFDDEIVDVFESCYIPVCFSNENKEHYIGVNSTKTMKAQQKARVAYLNNELFQYIQADAKNSMVPFVLCATHNSREETSTMDTIAFLGFLGGDSKSTKIATSEYIIGKYTEKEDIENMKDAYNRLLKVMGDNCEDAFNFAFNGSYFKNTYMYALLTIAKEFAFEKIAKKDDVSISSSRKDAVKDKNHFFRVLNASISVLEDKTFINSLKSKDVEFIIENVPVDSNGTGSFKKGAFIADKIFARTRCSKNLKGI